jgi:hypothetical protein
MPGIRKRSAISMTNTIRRSRRAHAVSRLLRPLAVSLLAVSALTVSLLAPVAASASTPTATATTEAACPGHWPASVQGQPTPLHAGARAGDYIWHDAMGWHLRVTHASSSTLVFSGRITASAPMRVTPFRLERGDRIALSADGLTITYRFYNHGRIDGLDFRTDCARRLAFAGYAAGAKLPTGRIWLGHYGRHPLENPFVVVRLG